MIHGVVRAFEDVGEDQIRFAVVDGDSAGDRNLGVRPGVSVVSVDFFLQFFKEFRVMVEVAFFQNDHKLVAADTVHRAVLERSPV